MESIKELVWMSIEEAIEHLKEKSFADCVGLKKLLEMELSRTRQEIVEVDRAMTFSFLSKQVVDTVTRYHHELLQLQTREVMTMDKISLLNFFIKTKGVL